MQVTYANQVRWEMEGAQVHAIMMEDFRMKGNNSMQMDKKSIKFEIRRTRDMKLWGECIVSSITPLRPYITVHKKAHVKWTKNLTKAILYIRTGALQFKTTWKVWNTKKWKRSKTPIYNMRWGRYIGPCQGMQLHVDQVECELGRRRRSGRVSGETQ